MATAGPRRSRVLAALLAFGVLALLAALLAGWILLATGTGRDLLLERLVQALPPGSVVIGTREGSLAGGLRLHGLVYRDPNGQVQVQVDRLELRPGWPGLAPAQLRLRLLHVQGLRVVRLDGPEAPPRSWAETLQALELPFALRIDRFHIDGPAGSLDGAFETAPPRRFATRGQGRLQSREGLQGQWSLDGDLEAGRFTFEGRAGGPLRLAGQWQEAADPARLGWVLDLDAEDLQAETLGIAGQQAPLHARLALRGGRSAGFAGEGLPLALSGQVGHGELSLEVRDSRLRWDGESLHAEPLALSLLGGRLDLHGHFRPADGTVQVEAMAEGLAWGEGEARVEAAGEARVQGGWDGWQGGLALDLARGGESATLVGEVRGNAEEAVLAPFRLTTAGGVLAGEARLRQGETPRLAVEARLQDFDPGWLLPGWPGRLQGDLRLHAEWPEAGPPRYRLAVDGLRGPLRGTPVAADLALESSADGSTLRLDLAAGDGRLDVRGRFGPAATLQAEVRAFELGPWVEGLEGRLDGRLDWQADLPAQGRGRLRLHAEGLDGLAGLPSAEARLHAEGDWARSGDGGHRLEFTVLELEAGGLPALRLDAPASLLLGRAGWRLPQPACFGLEDAGRLCAEGHERDVRLGGEGLDLARLAVLLPGAERLPLRPSGRFDVQARRHWGVGGPRHDLALQSADGRLDWLRPAAEDEIPEFGWRGLRFELEQADGWQARLGADLQPQGRIDAELALAADGTLAGSAALRVDDLAVLELLSPDLAAPQGRIEGKLTLSGRREAPRWAGAVSAAPLGFELPALGLVVHGGELHLAGDEDGRLRLQGNLPSGDGALRLEGEWRQAAREGRLSLRGREVRVLDTAEGRVWASPTLELAVGAERLHLHGRVEVPRAELDLDHLGGVAGVSPDVVLLDAPAAEATPGERLHADLRFVFGEAVRLRGHGFEGRLGGELRVRDRPGREPRGSGTLDLEGTLRAYGQTLELTRGTLRWANTPLDSPLLDLRAERPDAEPPVGVLLTGSARAPVAELWSQPPLPQAEVLSWLMFGRPLAATGGGDIAQLEQAAAALGGSALAQALAGQVGLDSASLGPAQGLDGTVLTVGKRISPRLYLSYGMALSGTGQVVAATWALRRWLAVRLEAGREQRLELEATFERDGGPPRFRPGR